jgi:hypothetical protein
MFIPSIYPLESEKTHKYFKGLSPNEQQTFMEWLGEVT